MASILIVDDSETVRHQLRKFLEGNGYSVLEAANGTDGLKKATENPHISLLISDFNIPGMNGMDMCREIKRKEEFKKLPVFMLTTRSNSSLKVLGKQIGIKVWIVKPFNEENLLFALKKVLG